MRRRPTGSTSTDTLCPCRTLVRTGCGRHRRGRRVRTHAGVGDGSCRSLALERRLGVERRAVAPDRRHREPRVLPPIGHGAIVRGGIAVDLDPIPSFGMADVVDHDVVMRSEEHTSELQSLMRISYAVFCLKKKNRNYKNHTTKNTT